MIPTILLVEDEAEIADTLKYALSDQGMMPVWVSTGKQAREMLAESATDFIILDVGLPDCNGFELLKEIRKAHDLPVMMLTARGDEVDRIVGLEIGADDYVTKPFSPRELAARVKAILKRTVAIRDSSKTGFEIDPKAMRITYFNQVLELTRSEYLLLSIFLKRPGQTFSRRQLIENVWSSHHPSDDRVIDTHIKELRAKLKHVNPDDSPIITHRGFGYSLEI
jgi:two-component system catabolic regulation response regulator CreB